METYLPGTGTLGWVVWCEAGISVPQGTPPDFYGQHVGMGPPIPCLCVSVFCAPPTYLDEETSFFYYYILSIMLFQLS